MSNKQPYFTLNNDKKTKLIHLGRRSEAMAMEYPASDKRLLEIVDEMTLINMRILKNNATE